MKKGLFITFEGPEGCGKTTQMDILEKYLRGRKYPVLRTREPGGTEVGCKIRSIILSPNLDSFASYAELFLFAADRLEHVEKFIKPALRKKKVILCDRYIDSTTAYQVGGRGLDAKTVNLINKISSKSIEPDLTILFDLDIKKGLDRATKIDKDRIEKEGISFHKKVRKKYLKIAEKDKRRIKLIKVGNKSVKQISEEVINLVENFVKNIEKNA